MNRRQVLKSALIPAALAVDVPGQDRPRGGTKTGKISKIEVLHLEKPLKERFWMANSPIGGYQPKASRLIVTVHTEGGGVGHGEGSGGGADLFKKGFAELIVGEDPFMGGKIWVGRVGGRGAYLQERVRGAHRGRRSVHGGEDLGEDVRGDVWAGALVTRLVADGGDRGDGADRRGDLRHHGEGVGAAGLQVSRRLSG